MSKEEYFFIANYPDIIIQDGLQPLLLLIIINIFVVCIFTDKFHSYYQTKLSIPNVYPTF